MAVDKSYGSGKPRSAANSSARRRVAAGKTPKSKRSASATIRAKGAGAAIKEGQARMAASPLGQIAETLYGFALPVGKVGAAAGSLINAGKAAKAAPLIARISAKAIGGSTNAEKALEKLGLELRGESAAKIFATANRSRILENAPKAWKKITAPKRGEINRGSAARDSAESLFPKLPIRGGDSPRLIRGSKDFRTFDKYSDPINEGAGRFKGRDDLSDFVSDMGKLGKFRKVGKAAAAAKNRGGR